MSSYVVEKERFIKAAGILAGIYEATSRNVRKLWVYDYERGHVMEAADYYDRFCELFLMNALSVQEQYHDAAPETDDNEYKATFAAFMQRGKTLMMYRDKLPKMVYELADFFREVQYQTEKDEYMFKMQMLFGNILRALLDLVDPYSDERMKRTMFEI